MMHGRVTFLIGYRLSTSMIAARHFWPRATALLALAKANHEPCVRMSVNRSATQSHGSSGRSRRCAAMGWPIPVDQHAKMRARGAGNELDCGEGCIIRDELT